MGYVPSPRHCQGEEKALCRGRRLPDLIPTLDATPHSTPHSRHTRGAGGGIGRRGWGEERGRGEDEATRGEGFTTSLPIIPAYHRPKISSQFSGADPGFLKRHTGSFHQGRI